MPADYLIVCPELKEYFDPQYLTNCSELQNFSMFYQVGMAMLLLTHHCVGYESPSIPNLAGRWVGKMMLTTGILHTKKDYTGNSKIGNLYYVARVRYTDISELVAQAIKSYEFQEHKEIPEPLPDEPLPDGVPPYKKDIPEPMEEPEAYENIRFRTEWTPYGRITIIEERDGDQWKRVNTRESS